MCHSVYVSGRKGAGGVGGRRNDDGGSSRDHDGEEGEDEREVKPPSWNDMR